LYLYQFPNSLGQSFKRTTSPENWKLHHDEGMEMFLKFFLYSFNNPRRILIKQWNGQSRFLTKLLYNFYSLDFIDLNCHGIERNNSRFKSFFGIPRI